MAELSETATREAYAEESGEVWLLLLTITHPDLTVPEDIIRICSEGVDVDNDTGAEFVESNGERFHRAYFEFDLPTDQEGETPKAQIRIDNVGEIELEDGTKVKILDELRRLSSAPTLHADIVLASQPDVVEYTLEDLSIVHIGGDAATLEGDLAYEDTLNQAFPRESYTPASFAALFP